MRIAVLSGKGGTGKTLLSVNIAACIKNSTYVDCDVEEPNGHLYFKPTDVKISEVFSDSPQININKCTACRKCAEFCAFNAIAIIGKKPMVFDEVCHACGGCTIVCPEGAISEKKRKVGEVHFGKSEDVRVMGGILNIGEASGMPVIDLLEENMDDNSITFVDCPPGCGCATMECVKNSDKCILIAEPTIFGAHNLQMVHELAKLFNKPCGVVLNKYGEGKNPSEEYCMENNLPIIGKIPFDEQLGLYHSNAQIAVRESDDYRKLFLDLYKSVEGGFRE